MAERDATADSAAAPAKWELVPKGQTDLDPSYPPAIVGGKGAAEVGGTAGAVNSEAEGGEEGALECNSGGAGTCDVRKGGA